MLTVTLGDTPVATIDDPGLGTTQESAQYNSFIDGDLPGFLDISVIPGTFVNSTEGAVVHHGVRNYHAPHFLNWWAMVSVLTVRWRCVVSGTLLVMRAD